jgi:hypothetical protein
MRINEGETSGLADTILETAGLTKEFRGFVAVDGVDLRVEREQRLGWDVDLPADLVTPDWLAS